MSKLAIMLHQLRQSEGYTQQQLASKLKIGQATLSYWESGKYQPDNDSLINLADIFNCSVDYLLGRTAEKEVTEMNIKDYRQSKDLTQEDLANEIGVTRSTVAMWEAGISKPRADTLIALSKVLDCTVDELIRENCVRCGDVEDKKISEADFEELWQNLMKDYRLFLSREALKLYISAETPEIKLNCLDLIRGLW